MEIRSNLPRPVVSTVPPLIVDLLKHRGLSDQEIQDFFSHKLQELPDLCAMHDLNRGAERIVQAIARDEKIAIYGDYDVDGTTSCALFYHFFAMLEMKVLVIQPGRFIEGYGLHLSSIDRALELGASLVITVDCGITNNEAALYALEKGIDLIITDHHKDMREEMPRAFAVINPNRRDEPVESPLRFLAGVGVAFAICVRVKQMLETQGTKIPTLYPLLQWVAIGTLCDLAKLTPMNLKLCRHGLKQIPKSEYPGIRQFFAPEEREVAFMPSEKISFNVGPLINSKGRLDHPEKALQLLTAETSEMAYECYSHLEISNRERKFIQAEVFTAARAMVVGSYEHETQAIQIVYHPEWHEGVIGIVASKLVETFRVPAIVFTDAHEEGVIKGSARTAGALNLFDYLKQCEDLFLKFGGHKAAAGMSLKKENLPLLRERLSLLLRAVPAIERTAEDRFDLFVSSDQINPELVRSLELLEPYGQGNPKPVFRSQDFKIESYSILKDLHVRWNFVGKKDPSLKVQGISFNFIGKWNQLSPVELFKIQNEQVLTLQFTLGVNKFRGNEFIQLMVERVWF